jgi:hypothetical protein
MICLNYTPTLAKTEHPSLMPVRPPLYLAVVYHFKATSGNIETKNMETANIRKVKKNKLTITIFTENHKMVGEIHLLPAHRLTDFMNKPDQMFLAVTNVDICDLSGKEIVSNVDFLSINKNHITMLYPLT